MNRTRQTDTMRRMLARDDGYVLLIVMGLMSVLTLLGISAWILSQQAMLDVQRADNTQQAFQAASAGFDAAMARVAAVDYAHISWPITGSTVSGSYSVVASLTPGSTTNTYTVTSRGTYNGVTQVVSMQFTQTYVPGVSLWDKYVFPNSGFNAVNGWSTTNFWGPLYTAGDFSVASLGGLPANVSTRPFTNQVYVYNGQSYIKKGVDSTFATMALVANQSQTQNPISGAGYSSWSRDCPPIALPTFGVNELRAEWTTATAAGRVPTSCPSPDSTATGPSALTITGVTPTTVYASDPHHYLSWTKNGGIGSIGLLRVVGVVYIDGPLTLPACNYTGKGTLVVRGPVTLGGQFLPYWGQLVMNNSPQYTPLSNAEVVGIITPGDLTADPGPGSNTVKDYKGNFGMAGAFYCGGIAHMQSNNNRIKGAMMASGLDAGGHNVHLVVDPSMPDILPPDMPGRDGSPAVLTYQRLYKTWSRQ